MTRFFKIFMVSLVATAALAARAQVPQPPEIAAPAYLLMDVSADQVLAARNMDDAVEPASLTKLMSTYLVFEALHQKKIQLEQTLPVSERAWKMPGSRMFIDPSMQVPVEDLLKGMIVQSGNDATVALAEGVGGTVEHFVEMMNAKARELGLEHTTYRNPEGLTEPGHTTTARDLATLSVRLLHDFPEFAHYHAIKKYRYPGTPESNDTNRNLLLFRDPTVDGLKTGHTAAAGYCMVATAQRDFPNLKGRRLLAIVLGADSESARATESQKLLNWGYTAFEGIELFKAGEAVTTPRVWKGTSDEVPLGSESAVIVAVPTGEAAEVRTEISRPEPLVAPFTRGQTVATLKISASAQGPVLAELPLVALEDVPEAGWMSRAWDAVRLWIHQLF